MAGNLSRAGSFQKPARGFEIPNSGGLPVGSAGIFPGSQRVIWLTVNSQLGSKINKNDSQNPHIKHFYSLSLAHKPLALETLRTSKAHTSAHVQSMDKYNVYCFSTNNISAP